ncbi:MAG: hypothetical protein LBT40_01615 [Deltaproteobacteria bacterium]|nr:hypothetical protein [Deltaproteobacteria bacterium]
MAPESRECPVAGEEAALPPSAQGCCPPPAPAVIMLASLHGSGKLLSWIMLVIRHRASSFMAPVLSLL